MKMLLGMEVGLSPGHIVLDRDLAVPPRKGHSSSPLFGPCLLWLRSPISATAELLFSQLWQWRCLCYVLAGVSCDGVRLRYFSVLERLSLYLLAGGTLSLTLTTQSVLHRTSAVWLISQLCGTRQFVADQNSPTDGFVLCRSAFCYAVNERCLCYSIFDCDVVVKSEMLKTQRSSQT